MCLLNSEETNKPEKKHTGPKCSHFESLVPLILSPLLVHLL